MASPVTDILGVVESQAVGVTGIVLVNQGHIEFPDDYSFEETVRALDSEVEGAFSFWMSDRQSGNQVTPGSVEVKGNLFINYEGVEASDGSRSSLMFDAIDLAEDLLAALVSRAAFLAVGSRVLSGNYLQVETTKDGIWRFRFTISYQASLLSCD